MSLRFMWQIKFPPRDIDHIFAEIRDGDFKKPPVPRQDLTNVSGESSGRSLFGNMRSDPGDENDSCFSEVGRRWRAAG